MGSLWWVLLLLRQFYQMTSGGAVGSEPNELGGTRKRPKWVKGRKGVAGKHKRAYGSVSGRNTKRRCACLARTMATRWSRAVVLVLQLAVALQLQRLQWPVDRWRAKSPENRTMYKLSLLLGR
jgi:hypothetical protein